MAEGLRSVGPNGVCFIRIFVGFATLSFFPAVHKPIPRKDWPSIAWLDLIWFAFPLSMFPYAEQRVSSALTGMLNGANPLFATLVASWILRRAPSRGITIGIAVGISGAVLMALPALREGHSEAIGIGMVVAALISYGFALSLARSLQQKYGAVRVTWRALGVAAIFTAPLGIPDIIHARWMLTPLLSLLALGAFGTGLAFFLLAAAAGRFGASRASGTALLIPVVALVLGVVVLHEQVAPISLAGGIVCLMGAWLMKQASSH